MRSIIAGLTSQTIHLKILDSSVTTGAGKTSLAASSTGIAAYYTRVGSIISTITLTSVTMAAAWSSGGFVEVSANAPGLYRLDIPDAAIAYANGVDAVVVSLNGVTNMAQCDKEFELVRNRLGIAAAGVLAGGGSTSSQTLPAADWNNVTTGYAMFVPGVGTRQITGYTAGTGVATFSTAFASDPSGLRFFVFARDPAESTVPFPVDIKKVNALTVSGDGTTTPFHV